MHKIATPIKDALFGRAVYKNLVTINNLILSRRKTKIFLAVQFIKKSSWKAFIVHLFLAIFA